MVYFVTKILRIVKQHDSIMVVVETLTKDAHFILAKTTHKETNIVEIYTKEVTKLDGVLEVITPNKYPKSTSNFWKGLFKGFGTNLNISTMYHPKLDGKIERTNKIIEDMLRIYVMDQPSMWEDYIHLVGFAYNNGYQASLKVIPFLELYGRKFHMPMSWDNLKDKDVIRIDHLLKEMEEQMTKIRKHLNTS
jgi:hypothetical protein